MRIEIADSMGCPVTQFVVHAENDLDRFILKAFLTFPDNAKDKWVFRKHGYTCDDSGYRSFNFGWVKSA